MDWREHDKNGPADSFMTSPHTTGSRRKKTYPTAQ